MSRVLQMTGRRTPRTGKQRERRSEMGGRLTALDPMQVEVPELKALLDRDPYLKPYEREFRRR